jgi:hypothetical protein
VSEAFRTIVRIYSLFRSERLSANIKLNLYKALIGSVITYAYPAWELAADAYLLNCSTYKTRFSAPLEVFQGANRSAIYTRLSNLHLYTIINQNCARNKQKSYEIMRMNTLAA